MLRAKDCEAVELNQWKIKAQRIRLLAMIFCAHRLRAYRKAGMQDAGNKLTSHTFAFANREMFQQLSQNIGESYYD